MTSGIPLTFLDMTVGQLLLVFVYFLNHAVILVLSEETDDGDGWGKAMGRIASFNLVFTMLLSLRSVKLVQKLFGISFERQIKFHRMLAIATVWITTAHAVYMLDKYGSDLSLSTDEIGEVKPLWGFVAWVCMLVMTVFAHEYVRRKTWKTFFIAHFLAGPVVVFAILHTFNSLLLLVPLILYVVDVMNRGRMYMKDTVITHASINPSSRSLRLCIKRENGQLCVNE